MTDHAQKAAVAHLHVSSAAKKRLTKRYRTDRNFRMIGLLSVLLTGGFLLALLSDLIVRAIPAFTYHYVNLALDLSEDSVKPGNPKATDYDGIIRTAIREQFLFVAGRKERRELGRIVSKGAGVTLRRDVLARPELLGIKAPYPVLLDDYADLYLKGLVTATREINTFGIASPTGIEGTIQILSTSNDFSEKLARIRAHLGRLAQQLRLQISTQQKSLQTIEQGLSRIGQQMGTANDERRNQFEAQREKLQKGRDVIQGKIERLRQDAEILETRSTSVGNAEVLDDEISSYLIYINGGVVKATSVSNSSIEGEIIIPLASTADAKAHEWQIVEIEQPQSSRKISDQQIVYLEHLSRAGVIERRFNSVFFSSGASRDPEMAGVWGAVVGSFFTMVITLALAFPLGLASAIYLEEFAPKNRITKLIEVNINNLAAVPSIIFGLLGLAVFLNFFALPRSAALVGGLVLALMTLPTIIIASRAALKSVPPSIREAAYGIGASKLQTIFHHVLPLAMPGILTGTIIGMAQALGETAPFLMIGMWAFIVDIPGGFLEPATVLPIQIFMWADFPEPAFQQKTAAAIIILLIFLLLMNAVAVFLRKRFERRW